MIKALQKYIIQLYLYLLYLYNIHYLTKIKYFFFG